MSTGWDVLPVELFLLLNPDSVKKDIQDEYKDMR